MLDRENESEMGELEVGRTRCALKFIQPYGWGLARVIASLSRRFIRQVYIVDQPLYSMHTLHKPVLVKAENNSFSTE